MTLNSFSIRKAHVNVGDEQKELVFGQDCDDRMDKQVGLQTSAS